MFWQWSSSYSCNACFDKYATNCKIKKPLDMLVPMGIITKSLRPFTRAIRTNLASVVETFFISLAATNLCLMNISNDSHKSYMRIYVKCYVIMNYWNPKFILCWWRKIWTSRYPLWRWIWGIWMTSYVLPTKRLPTWNYELLMMINDKPKNSIASKWLQSCRDKFPPFH